MGQELMEWVKFKLLYLCTDEFLLKYMFKDKKYKEKDVYELKA